MNFITAILTVHLGLTPVDIIGGSITDALEPINRSIVKLGTCTGTLVGERAVLTAAHCFNTKNPFPYGVTYAAGLSEQSCTKSWVEAYSRPPGAVHNERGFTYPDLLLLKLGSRLCGAVPARLGPSVVTTGEVVRAAGYGKGSVSKIFPTRLDLRATSKNDFDALYADITPTMNPNIERTKHEIHQHGLDHYDLALAVKPGETVCNGDSGGPVYREADASGLIELVGVNGAIVPHELKGPEACQHGFLQLYTPIATYLSWIREKSAKWETQP